MSERLVIKNFGPIKHVDLDIKKVNVLIGDQGTGKSTVAKILNIIKNNFYKITSLQDFKRYLIEDHFNFKISDDTFIELISGYYTFTLINNGIRKEINEVLVERIQEKIEGKITLNIPTFFYEDLAQQVNYIPTERIIISMLTIDFFSFIRSSNLPISIIEFGQKFNKIIEPLLSLKYEFLDVEFYFSKGNNEHKIRTKNATVSFYEAASGLKSVLPLLVNLDNTNYYNSRGNFLHIIEEPEQNLFPITQYELVKYIQQNCSLTNNSYFLTTHSPYILTSLNNLMEAFIVGENNAEKVNEIIDKKYWLNPKDVSAYMLTTDGIAETIIAEDGLIMTEKIDAVSDVLNGLYDKLLDIKYSNNQ